VRHFQTIAVIKNDLYTFFMRVNGSITNSDVKY
jgi:hypothetical protein